MSNASKILLTGVAAGTVTAVVGMPQLAKYMAKATVTPIQSRADSFSIKPHIDGDNLSVDLPIDDETIVEGKYSLYFTNGAGHARVGKILSKDPALGTITREVEHISFGNFSSATGGSWYGYAWYDPGELGLDYQEVNIETENGPAPSWMVPAEAGKVSETCVIQVHGRGASKAEGLRSVPALLDEGMDVLLINYRNDFNGPREVNGLYGLGYTEWRDVEVAIKYALERGAKNIILFGWSMGGAIVMQTYMTSKYRNKIKGIVLDAPALDWKHILQRVAVKNNLPKLIGTMATYALSGKMGAFVKQNSAVVNTKALKWLDKADDIEIPILLFHSVDDEFVPYEPSEELAEKRPDKITFIKSYGAQHTKEWNLNPEQCNAALKSWLEQLEL
ncbi:MAG: alpha/beta fold hydrolase [Micrococcaceae bacterium]